VEKAVWNAECSRWTLTIDGGREYESEILINASGILNNPKFPELDGLESFGGEIVHTAAWDKRVNVTGKRLAIVGAGASAIQVLPALQKDADHVDIYIRTPSWITPPSGASFSTEHNHTYTPDEKAQFVEDDEYSLRVRKEMEASFNAMFGAFVKGSEKQHEMRSRIERRMKELVRCVDLQQKLIPTFEAGCRRLNPGERYLEALQQENVTPIFESIQTVTSDGIQDFSGKVRPADVLIAATGFDTSFRPRFPILGSGGRDLRELWKDEPASYCGLAVSGFPNYLIFLGPNTPISNGSLMGILEGTADFFVRLIRKLRVQQATSFDILQSVQDDFNDHAQGVMKDLVWTGSCRSWFKNSRGRVTAVWPGSGLHYREFLESDRWEDFEWRYNGNRFAHWGLGFSHLERSESPDLSYWIKPYPNLPLEALQRVACGQDSAPEEQIHSGLNFEPNIKPVKIHVDSEETSNSGERIFPNRWVGDLKVVDAPHIGFLSSATAFSV
jgi:cation diffusion facilitator CzcD-associated flavoprotein CzcO